MKTLINGLHHVTSLASTAQTNVDFYVGILGLRMIKKTVNFDAPEIYHLYYADEIGTAGTVMTFFPYGQMPRGRKGAGQLTYTAFSIAENALDFWIKRLEIYQIPTSRPKQRLGETYIQFEDFDGMGVELVTTKNDSRTGWLNGVIPNEFIIKGFHTVTLHEANMEKTLRLLIDSMQHRIVAEEGNRYRLEAGEGGTGNYVDIIYTNDQMKALQGAGTVHHVAFSTSTDETQVEIREILASSGYGVTPVIDRNYFHSIYYREPGGILFEIATNPPGFAVDESPEKLGQKLQLPPWYEQHRPKIEGILPPIKAVVFP